MTGGLIQLVTTGIQDSPLIGNPEVTFFKTVYKQHTMFSLCQNDRYLGTTDFGRNATKVIEKNGDLLYNQYFKVDIPYFDIVRTISSITKTDLGYNLNDLSVTYMNTNCIVLYLNNTWYIVPEKIFNISQFKSLITSIDSNKTQLANNLLPEYITLTELGSNVNLYQLKDNDVSPIISVLRINSNFWEQYWLNTVSTSTDFKMMNPMLTLKSKFGQLYYLLKNRIFNLYPLRNLFALNSNAMIYEFALVDTSGNKIYDEYGNVILQNEMERYYNYTIQGDNIIKLNTQFDIDLTYKYCQQNFINFNNYRDTCLPYIPLLFSLMYKLLFATPDLNFTFWKKYSVSTNNTVNKTIKIDDTHYMNEWGDNLNKYMFELFNTNNINNMIFDKLKSVYLSTEEKITNVFNNMELDNPSEIYIKLKTFISRYYLIPFQQINFNNYYMATKYDSVDLTKMFNNDEYTYTNNLEASKYSQLKTSSTNLSSDEMNNMTPVDMIHIYPLISMDVINLLFQNKYINSSLKSFIILWRNTITNRIYRKFLDEYKSVVTNSTMISPTIDRRLTLYYSITPSNLFTLTDFKNSYYSMFYRSSWIGRLNLESNNFQKFIESIHKVEVNNLFNTNFSASEEKDFYAITITNTYNYTYKTVSNRIDAYGYYVFDSVIYDSTNYYIYIKYDNYYNKNSTITLTIGGTQYNYKSISLEVQLNELNTNTLYLKFDLSNNSNFTLIDSQVITLNATYKNYLPLVAFYKDNMIYNNIQSKRYYLLDKFSNNTVKLSNIVDSNNINIEKLKNNLMLTITYLDVNNIIPPVIDSSMIVVSQAISTKKLTPGLYRYAVSYYTATAESEMSNILDIMVGENQIVSITYMATDNDNVLGIKIYRTRANSNTFYLVSPITIDFEILYDDKTDDILGVDYNINSQVKLNKLPKSAGKCTRVPIYLEKNNNTYSMYNMDGTKYYLPSSYTNIKNIYIDEIKFGEILDETTFSLSEGAIIFNDVNDYSSNCLYYLINPYNNKDTVKLVLSNDVVNMNKLTLTQITKATPSSLTTGTYKYMITIANSDTSTETLPSQPVTIKINSGEYIVITNFTSYNPSYYDSWNIYRTNGTTNDFYFLTTIFGLEEDIIDDGKTYKISSMYTNPYLNITTPIYKGILTNPLVQPVINNMNTSGNIIPGDFKYMYTYYNNSDESLPSTAVSITTTTLTQIEVNINAVNNSSIIGIKIYRTKESGDYFYQIANITSISSAITFIDNTSDSNLTVLIPKTYKLLKVPNNTYILDKPNTSPILESIGNGNMNTGVYKYFYTYYTDKSYQNIETIASPSSNITITSSMVKITIPVSSNNDVTGRKIYRTKVNDSTFYLVGMIENNTITEWIDNMNDSTLDVEYVEQMQNIIPNLNSFMSHSTDINYMNTKNLSDMNDYFFNKPFIMMVNGSMMNTFNGYNNLVNSFTQDNVYFYNIPFKINATSVITLNSNRVNYLLPISMQQYFVKESNETYYLNDLTKMEPSQRTFYPAFDEFSLTVNFILNNTYYFYADAMIDIMVSMIDNILSTNADYNKIINTMESANTNYLNIFTNMIDYNNTLYGLTSRQILYYVDTINNIGSTLYYILNFDINILAPNPCPMIHSNIDFLRYSHNAMRLVDDGNILNDSKLVTFKTNILNILSPVYNYYSSSKKVSPSVYAYFNTISNLFIDHKKFISDNIDYLNLSNPDNYNEKYLSYQEIIQETYNKFKDYSGTNTIVPLTQIYDSGFYKIILDDKTITNFSLDGNIKTPEYTQNIQSNDYNDTSIITTNRNLYRNNKFNYMGIISIDNTSKPIFNDMYTNSINPAYYKFDDNKIYMLSPNGVDSRYSITYELTDSMIINPYELVFNNSNNLQTIQLNKLDNLKYVYSYDITFSNTFTFSGTTNFLINNTIYMGTIINNTSVQFILILDTIINFIDTVLIYESVFGDKTSWQVSPTITNIIINNFKVANYYTNNTLSGLGINTDDIYMFNTDIINYYDVSTIREINNVCYFNLASSNSTINIMLYNKKISDSIPSNSYVIYNIRPSLVIRSGMIYSYYADGMFTRDILNTDTNYHILLIDTQNNRYYMLKIGDITMKQIPKGNYHTYILPSDSINMIKYNGLNISIDSNGNVSGMTSHPDGGLPTYSFYMIGGSIYYYEKNDTIIVNSTLPYYNINTNVTEVFLIDNMLFNTEMKQLVGLTKKYNITENFITKKLTTTTSFNFESLNYLVYNSKYSNTEETVQSYNVDSLQLLGANEVIVEMILQNTNMTTMTTIYQPIVIKKYEDNTVIPRINFTYNTTNYSKSFIPINSTNLFNANILINDIVIGTINNTTDTFVSISPNIIIDNNSITLKVGYIVSNSSFEIKLWKIKGIKSNNTIYYVYFWTLFTNDTNLIQNYLDIITDTTNNIGISEPVYLDSDSELTIQNYCLQCTMIYCYPPILRQDNTNITLDSTSYDTTIYYQYYTDTRHTDIVNYNHIIKELDYNSVMNIKPTIEFLANNNRSTVMFSNLQTADPLVFNNAKYFILFYQRISTNSKEYKVLFKSEVPYQLYFDYDYDISDLTVYYSVNYPTFINNVIVLGQITTTKYEIVTYSKLYLEMNEMIVLDGNIFIVNGLSLKSNRYTITLIKTGTNLRNKYNGYYTLGNYTRKDNKVMPDIEYETMLTYKLSYTAKIGDMYYDNINKFIIATSETVVNNVSIFKESSLKIKLYYMNGKLFLFDNMIKLKNTDRILCTVDNIIYTIQNIRDGMIILDSMITLVSTYNNSFVSFILPYQPFTVKYMNFNTNGTIVSERIADNTTLLLDTLNTYCVNNNMINTNTTVGYKWVRIMNTVYTSFFENTSFIPVSTTNFKITNKYPVELNVNYDRTINRLQILNNSSIMTNFNFFYLQPIFISGTYNYVKNITFDGNNYLISLINPMNILDGMMKVVFSPSYINNKDYYNMTKIRYNFGIQSHDYDTLVGKNIEVTRFIVKDDLLVLVQTKVNNKQIIFKYGVSIATNESNNKIINNFINDKFAGTADTYTSVYFYGQFPLNSDGTIDTYDTLIGSYHLICQVNTDFNRVNLCKIVYPNNLSPYKPFLYNFLGRSYLGRIMCIKSNFMNEFVYGDMQIVQCKKMAEINNNKIQLIKKYDIRMIGIPEYSAINSTFKHEIQFVGPNTFSQELYNTIYLDETLSQSYRIVGTGPYYIMSPTYLSNEIKTIYTVLINYIDSATMSTVTKKDKKMAAKEIDYYIDTKIVNTEAILYNINFSKVSAANNIYNFKYKLDDKLDNFKLNPNENYFIQYISQTISSINNNTNTITLTYPINSNTLILTDDYDRLEFYTIRTVNIDTLFDPTKLFTNVKELKISLFNNSNILDIDIFNKMKPWKTWALLNSIKGVNMINRTVNNCYLQFENNIVVKKTDSSVIYSYLTNNEIVLLTQFLKDVNKSPDALTNFNRMKDTIEPLILSNLKNWLANPWFFLNVTTNINTFLAGAGHNDITFDGNKLVFTGDSCYITNEYAYDNINNVVYRSVNSYNKINSMVSNFINSINIAFSSDNYFGISIHLLLQTLRLIGDQFIQLNNNFTNLLNSTPEYSYNNPLKFIINKIWENHSSDKSLVLLDKSFQQNETTVMRYTKNSNIYSSINYLINLDISYFGIYSPADYKEFTININSEYNMNTLTQYKDTVLKPVQIINKLIITTLYPYQINFKTDEITSGATYSIDFLNGENIMSDYTITNSTIYPDELSFTSPLNILSSEFITVKKKNSFNVTSSIFLGYLYSITFDMMPIVDSVYFRNYNLTITSTSNNMINILVPLSLIELGIITEINTTDIFEIRNNISILSIKKLNNNIYLTFLNPSIIDTNFIANKTLLRTPTNIYMLMKDNNQYYITGAVLDSYDCVLINLINATNIVNMNQGVYNIILSTEIVNSLSSYNSMDFKYSNNTATLTPTKVKSIGSSILQFYFVPTDISTINSMTGWNTVTLIKRVGHDITNTITKLEKIADYAYYFNYKIPLTTNTVIYLYDTSNNNVLESNIVSLDVKHIDNITRFTLNSLIGYTSLSDIMSFIQKNSWTLTDYIIIDNVMTITVPSDFVINVGSKYSYKINNIIINKGSFLYDGNKLSFSWVDNTSGPIVFAQYYVETTIGVIMRPVNNMKVKITLDFPYQYNVTNQFYILPYDSNGIEFNNYFYKLKTSDTSILNGFGMVTMTNNIITLYRNGIVFNGIIFDEYYDGTSKYYIISLNEKLDTTLSYMYSLTDMIVKNVVSISYYQDLLFKGDTSYQDSSNYIYIYTNSSINEYIPINTSDKPNRFYLIGYSDYKLTNMYYEPTFVQNPNMMKQIIYNTTTANIIEKPKFKTYDKLFSFIRLYFNDQMMEELNEYVFNINYHLYSTEEQRRQLDKMVLIRKNSSYELYIPLIFWFSKKAGMSLPTVALPNTQLRLEYKLNDINYILDNDLSGSYMFSTKPTCKLTLQSEFILLDSMERKLFGSFSHEYVIDRYVNAPHNNITNDNVVLVKNWSGLIKDIHFIAEPENYTGLNYFPEITNDYDYQYMRYVTAVKYYKMYQTTNYFTSDEQRQYNLDINIIAKNTIDLNNYILTNGMNNNTKIQKYIDYFSRWSIWDTSYNLLKFILYYDDKYISFVPEDQRLYSITIYLSYLYSNKIKVREVSPVQSLLLRVNGNDLFAERDWNYYTNVVPYQKFKNSLPTGYYTYTFSLHPMDDQHSGHLNFSFFDDIVVKVRSNMTKPDGSTYGPYKLNTILREYNILRIMSGMGNLAWIN